MAGRRALHRPRRAFTYNYIIDNELEAYTSYTVGLEHVEAVDDLTARFICSRPKSNMLGMWVPIVPEHIWSKVSPKDGANTFQNKPPIVGTGPFQVVDFNKQNHFVRMVANKDYWRGAPLIDEVVFTAYTNPDTMVRGPARAAPSTPAGACPRASSRRSRQTAGFKTIAYVVKGFDELGFNCYTGPSLGNPVLKDWRFRQALNWAIDKQQLVKIAYAGYAVPGDTIIVPNFYTNPDWHWQPPADQLYGYDPAKATQLLADAGYKTVGGKLLDKQGKPITLRLLACDAPPQGQKIGKLLTAWLQAIGIKVKFAYMTEGAMNDYLYNAVDGRFTPNMDLYIYNWTGDVDPTFILSIFLTSQINNWSDCAWSDPQYDALFKQQSQTIDPRRARTSSGRCSRSSTSRTRTSCSPIPRGSRLSTRRTGRLGAVAYRHGLGDLLGRQHRQLPLCAPHGGGCEGELAVAPHRRYRGRGGGRRCRRLASGQAAAEGA